LVRCNLFAALPIGCRNLTALRQLALPKVLARIKALLLLLEGRCSRCTLKALACCMRELL
jgi:hypothetical protein